MPKKQDYNLQVFSSHEDFKEYIDLKLKKRVAIYRTNNNNCTIQTCRHSEHDMKVQYGRCNCHTECQFQTVYHSCSKGYALIKSLNKCMTRNDDGDGDDDYRGLTNSQKNYIDKILESVNLTAYKIYLKMQNDDSVEDKPTKKNLFVIYVTVERRVVRLTI